MLVMVSVSHSNRNSWHTSWRWHWRQVFPFHHRAGLHGNAAYSLLNCSLVKGFCLVYNSGNDNQKCLKCMCVCKCVSLCVCMESMPRSVCVCVRFSMESMPRSVCACVRFSMESMPGSDIIGSNRRHRIFFFLRNSQAPLWSTCTSSHFCQPVWATQFICVLRYSMLLSFLL